ncbi:hypothetical protein [Kineococcus indalonis]|uniref:hypothetical protein n=1 Tax=Kineococcus indalonis TaxID=2696566 RepID=UPI001411FD12|nr:hypothetical protein [Kineococcus indalonis]NAZ85703.1 hypothetical protein [Kineococcus indalonis]
MTVELTRREDLRLLRGAGRHVADVPLPRLLDAAFVRSPVAHGVLVDVDVSAARGVPGVLGAWAARDLPGLPVVPPFGQPGDAEGCDWPSLAVGRVRHVGQPLAVVLADDRYRAEDGVDAVRHRIEPLPALVDPAASGSTPWSCAAGTSGAPGSARSASASAATWSAPAGKGRCCASSAAGRP